MPETIKVPSSEFECHSRGVCLACGQFLIGVEPDAREYDCDSCGRPEVYGLEEALVMGRIEVVDDKED